jgi:arylformamidase
VEQGIAFAALEYDLCPTVSIEQITAQMVQALNHLAEHTPYTRWLLSGHSAGGHLAMMLWSDAVQLTEQARSKLQACMSLSGVHDLTPLLQFSANEQLLLTAETAKQLSPIHHTPRNNQQVLVAVGGEESSEFIRQSDILGTAWQLLQPTLKVPHTNHFTVLAELANPQSNLFKHTKNLLN